MNNDQSDCPKCYRKFHNKSSLAHHLESCSEDQQIISEEEKDPLALDAPGEVKMETEETDNELLEDAEEKEPLNHVQPIPAGNSKLQFSRGDGKGKRGRLDCYYCGVTTSDRISLSRHLVGQHWDQVRERQGGGRRDNRQYYSNLQDSRVIKPAPKCLVRNSNYHSGNLPPPPNRKIFPKPTHPTYNWAARIKDQDFQLLNKKATTPSASRFSNSLFGKTPNRKIAPKPIYGKPSVPFYGKIPNRKIAPRPSSGGTVSTPGPKSVPLYGKAPNRNIVLRPSNSVLTSGGLIQAKRSIPTVDLTTSSVEKRRRQPVVSRAIPAARSTIPNTNHRSLNKVGPNSELDKLVKKFANSNSALQITKVSK